MSTAVRPRETLSRAQRLRSSRDFLRLKDQGKRQVHGCLIMNWQAAPPGVAVSIGLAQGAMAQGSGETRLGVVTSKRVGGAVVRNRARRLLREVFRRNRYLLPPNASVVLVARPSIAGMGYAQVERDFVETLRRARLLAANPLQTSPLTTPTTIPARPLGFQSTS